MYPSLPIGGERGFSEKYKIETFSRMYNEAPYKVAILRYKHTSYERFTFHDIDECLTALCSSTSFPSSSYSSSSPTWGGRKIYLLSHQPDSGRCELQVNLFWTLKYKGGGNPSASYLVVSPCRCLAVPPSRRLVAPPSALVHPFS